MTRSALFALAALLLALTARPPATAAAVPPSCAWHYGTCWADLYQWEETWLLNIYCADGDGGTWLGHGTWGGSCPSDAA